MSRQPLNRILGRPIHHKGDYPALSAYHKKQYEEYAELKPQPDKDELKDLTLADVVHLIRSRHPWPFEVTRFFEEYLALYGSKKVLRVSFIEWAVDGMFVKIWLRKTKQAQFRLVSQGWSEWTEGEATGRLILARYSDDPE